MAFPAHTTKVLKPGVLLSTFRLRITADHVREVFEDFEVAGGARIWVFDLTAITGFGHGVLDESFRIFEKAQRFGLHTTITVTTSDDFKMATASMRETVDTMSGIDMRLVESTDAALAMVDGLLSQEAE